jgi:lipopolysaccharide biosynthesis protein
LVMNMDFLSSDLVEILGKLMRNDNIAKLVGNDITRPFESDRKAIGELAPFGLDQRFFPYPFNIEYKENIRSQVHIYFPTMTFESNDVVENILVWFDIVIHKDLWLIEKREENAYQKLIRPYEIAHYIAVEMKRIDLNRRDLMIDLVSFDHLSVNENYHAIRLEGRLMNWQ